MCVLLSRYTEVVDTEELLDLYGQTLFEGVVKYIKGSVCKEICGHPNAKYIGKYQTPLHPYLRAMRSNR